MESNRNNQQNGNKNTPTKCDAKQVYLEDRKAAKLNRQRLNEELEKVSLVTPDQGNQCKTESEQDKPRTPKIPTSK